jgi:DNA primase
MMFDRLESLAQHRLEGRKKERFAPVRPMQQTGKPTQQRTPMRMALAHLVQDPSLAAEVENLEAFEGCDLPGFEIWRELVDFCAKSPNMTTAQLLELLYEHPAQSHLNKLATWQFPGEEALLVQEFRDAVTGLELQWTESLIARMPKIVELGAEGKLKLLALQQRRQELIERLNGEES